MIELPEIDGLPRPEAVRVAVVCGGQSAEGEVSRASGTAVWESLRGRFGRVDLLEMDDSFINRLCGGGFDVVFPVMHGPLGEDGTLQGLLEMLGFPYVGCGVLASACGINKIVAKRLFREAGLPVAAEVVVHASEDPRKAAAHTAEQLGEDVIVKPSAEGSAVGVAFARNRDELIQALSAAAEFGEDILVEERIEGAEITVGVIEGKRPLASPLVEVRTPEGSWYDYEHRYTPGLSEHVIPADLAAGPSERVRGLAVAAHEALFCRDLSRVDFMVASDGRAAVLEVNTIPGMTPTSLYPDAMMAAGVEFPELTAYLVRRALARGRATTASAA